MALRCPAQGHIHEKLWTSCEAGDPALQVKNSTKPQEDHDGPGVPHLSLPDRMV